MPFTETVLHEARSFEIHDVGIAGSDQQTRTFSYEIEVICRFLAIYVARRKNQYHG